LRFGKDSGEKFFENELDIGVKMEKIQERFFENELDIRVKIETLN
jgi:hypothetical protein